MERADWDDLRILLAVARHGSAAAAARALKVVHATVLRRVKAAERAYGVKLFDRSAGNYVPTAEGQRVLAAAASIDETVMTLRRGLAGHEGSVQGVVRLTTTDTLAELQLVPSLARFREKHPALSLNLLITNNELSLHKLEADIAVRTAMKVPASLVGTRIGTVAFAPYARIDARKSGDWLVLEQSLQRSAIGMWFERNVEPERIALRANSFAVVRSAAEAGLGVAVLPCFVGDRSPQLARIGDRIAAVAPLWVLTHAELRGAPRIRAVMDYLVHELRQQRDLLAGKR